MRAEVVLSPRAEQARSELPARIRHQVNEAIRRIADQPDWAAAIGDSPPPLRVIAPGHSVNSGLIADLSVSDGTLNYVIVYRVKNHRSVVWIEDIRPVFIG